MNAEDQIRALEQKIISLSKENEQLKANIVRANALLQVRGEDLLRKETKVEVLVAMHESILDRILEKVNA